MLRPMRLDVHAIGAAVVRNNMGVGSITLWVRGRVEGGHAVLHGTGQQLPLAGGPAPADGPWLELRTDTWDPPAIALHGTALAPPLVAPAAR